ncbi:uncharacterized protein LOC142621440 [Castanea sativa]|uniref:uncharacterized protein LOC142621440 n=1 Tax=Castanea sativa TaxID=21020 RepID=UPI003F64A6B8
MARENALSLSSEEKNELIRSNKKVKDKHYDTTEQASVEPLAASDAIHPRLSFKDKLIGEIPGAFAQAFDLRDREETEMTPSSNETDMESDAIRELREGLVTAKISQSLKQRIRAPWSKALIVKVYGRTVGYNFLHAKILALWKPVGRIDCIDLGKDFFLIRFLVKEDHDVVLKNGPWFIGENFLSIRPWVPNFKPATTMVSSVAVWVHLNELPIKYNDTEALLIISQAIGNVLRIDTHTATETRGRYARLCIQVDIEKPLANAVLVDNFEQPVTYEVLNRFCFTCGRIGHRREECFYTVKKPASENPSTLEDRDSPNREDNCAKEPRPCVNHDVDPKDDTYGPWMVVSRKKNQ